MRKTQVIYWIMGLMVGMVPVLSGQSLLVGFEDLSLVLPEAETYGGPGGGVYHNGSDLAGGFSSGGVSFVNTYTDWGGGFTSWAGWGYSTTTDVVTGDFSNQYSAYPGTASGGQVYGIGFVDPYSGMDPVVIDLPAGWEAPLSIDLGNTTYTALTLRDGNGFATAFGQGDYFKLTIGGLDASGAETGAIEYYLADYRGAAETHIIQADWGSVDLSALGSGVDRLTFDLESTDVGNFGMNTPAYFALDNLLLGATPVPEPATGSLVLALAGLALLAWRRR
jgi:uncharacterized protein (TIGR03382 family)